jgi:hypothetical protein
MQLRKPAAQLPWGHQMVLVDKLSARESLDWHAATAAEHGWSRNVLMIMSQTMERTGSAPSHFAE